MKKHWQTHKFSSAPQLLSPSLKFSKVLAFIAIQNFIQSWFLFWLVLIVSKIIIQWTHDCNRQLKYGWRETKLKRRAIKTSSSIKQPSDWQTIFINSDFYFAQSPSTNASLQLMKLFVQLNSRSFKRLKRKRRSCCKSSTRKSTQFLDQRLRSSSRRRQGNFCLKESSSVNHRSDLLALFAHQLRIEIHQVSWNQLMEPLWSFPCSIT